MKPLRKSRTQRLALNECGRFTATAIALVLLTISAPWAAAQGSPDIVWQGQHNGYVRYTTFSPDGQQLASGSDEDRTNKF